MEDQTENNIVNLESLFSTYSEEEINKVQATLEALIFASDKPLPISKMLQVIDGLGLSMTFNQSFIQDLLKRIEVNYQVAHHGIYLYRLEDTYQFRTKLEMADPIQRLFKPSFTALGPIAMEVLAIIAYRQPVSRNKIDLVRGVDSSHILRNLLKRNLIKISGRSEEAGRPSIYTTTRKFLELFNLSDISELPPEYELDILAKKDEADEFAQLSELIEQHELFEEQEIGELTEIVEDLKNIKDETPFIKDLRRGTTQSGALPSENPTLEVTPATPAKQSSFEILEEHLEREQVRQENQLAALSSFLELQKHFLGDNPISQPDLGIPAEN